MSENLLEASFIFEKEGKYNDVWLAATNEKLFKQRHKRNINQYQITDIWWDFFLESVSISNAETLFTTAKELKPTSCV